MTTSVLQQITFSPSDSPESIAEKIRSVGDPTDIARLLLQHISQSGALLQVASVAEQTRRLHALFDDFDTSDRTLAYLDHPPFIERLEYDFALAVPIVADAAVPLENWAIPLLAAFAGPLAPLVSFGLLVAIKIALAALTAWAKKKTQGKVLGQA